MIEVRWVVRGSDYLQVRVDFPEEITAADVEQILKTIKEALNDNCDN